MAHPMTPPDVDEIAEQITAGFWDHPAIETREECVAALRQLLTPALAQRDEALALVVQTSGDLHDCGWRGIRGSDPCAFCEVPKLEAEARTLKAENERLREAAEGSARVRVLEEALRRYAPISVAAMLAPTPTPHVGPSENRKFGEALAAMREGCPGPAPPPVEAAPSLSETHAKAATWLLGLPELPTDLDEAAPEPPKLVPARCPSTMPDDPEIQCWLNADHESDDLDCRAGGYRWRKPAPAAPQPCPYCKGSGSYPTHHVCANCHGTGTAAPQPPQEEKEEEEK